jgi:hypothetical protein
MGNRANVVFCNREFTEFSPTVYLHWNGGPESIYAFLAELDRRKVRGAGDLMYQVARFVHVVGDFFDGDPMDKKRGATSLSLGVTNPPTAATPEAIAKVPTDTGDNGFYLVYREPTKDGSTLTVRRFVGYDKMRELTAQQVKAEQKQAAKSDYGPQFAEFFAKLRPVISRVG